MRARSRHDERVERRHRHRPRRDRRCAAEPGQPDHRGEVTSLEIDNRKSIITAVARTPAGEVLLGKTALIGTTPSTSAHLQGRAGHDWPRRPARVSNLLPCRLRRARPRTSASSDGATQPSTSASRPAGTRTRRQRIATAPQRRRPRGHPRPGVARRPAPRAGDRADPPLRSRATVLVIDVGSLTTDFTVVADLHARPSERGHGSAPA